MSARGSDYTLTRLAAGTFMVTTQRGGLGMIAGTRGAWSALLAPGPYPARGLPSGTEEKLGEAIRTQNEAAERVLAAYARHWMAAHPDPVMDPPALFTDWEKHGAGVNETASTRYRYHHWAVQWDRVLQRFALRRDGITVATVRDAHEVRSWMVNYELRERVYWAGWLAP